MRHLPPYERHFLKSFVPPPDTLITSCPKKGWSNSELPIWLINTWGVSEFLVVTLNIN